MTRKRAPVNRSRRADRIDGWNAEAEAGRRYRPRPIAGTGAVFEWIRAIQASDLPSTARLVGITLVLNGNADGSNIFPGVRRIAEQAALSQRAVGDHLGTLVGRGFLLRKPRRGDLTAGGCGFEYLLRKPEVLIDGQHWKPVLIQRQHTADRRSARKPSGADPSAGGADSGDSSVLTERQPTTVLPLKDHQARPRAQGRGRFSGGSTT